MVDFNDPLPISIEKQKALDIMKEYYTKVIHGSRESTTNLVSLLNKYLETFLSSNNNRVNNLEVLSLIKYFMTVYDYKKIEYCGALFERIEELIKDFVNKL